MGNTRKLKRAQQRAKTSARPAPSVGTRRSKPWMKYAGIGGGLAVLLLLVVYIATDLSSGGSQGVADPPEGFEVIDVGSPEHVDGPVAYEQEPPAGGPHNATPQACEAYDEPVASENVLHSLEHGAAWITYQPDLASDAVDTLEDFVRRGEVLVSPYPNLDSPIVVTTWGRQLRVDSADDPRIDQFIRAFKNQTAPENAAGC